MVGVSKALLCPLCGKGENAQGRSFSSPRALSLHVSWFAIHQNDVHQSWVLKLMGNPDFTTVRDATINQIETQIRFHVMELVTEAEERSSEGEAEELIQMIETYTRSLGIPDLVAKEWQRTQEERNQYIRAYAIIWDIETILHRFSELILSGEHGANWWVAFPLILQHHCIYLANQDSNQVSPDCYVNFLDLSEIIKKKDNKVFFQPVFDNLRSDYKDPQSEFHNKIRDVNNIRNKVMHPLKRQTPIEEDIVTLEHFLEFVRKLTTKDQS